MKICVSNIAWETYEMAEHLHLLKELGVDGLELSPSMVFPFPTKEPIEKWRSFKLFVNGFGLELASLHSVTYPRPDLNFYDSEKRAELIDYVVSVGNIASELEIPHMVFGSGRSRNVGERDRSKCYEVLVSSFREISERLLEKGVSLLIEPLSSKDSDIIHTIEDGAHLVRDVNSSGFGLHVDLRSTFMNEESQEGIWTQYGDRIMHCHVADPGMLPPSESCTDHFRAAKAMKKAQYNKYLSVEMRRELGKTKENIQKSVKFLKEVYQ